MKYLFHFIVYLLPLLSSGQSVIFCEDVSNKGEPKNASHEFTIGSNGGFIKVLVKLNKEIRSETAVLDVYNVIDGKESFNNSIKMEVRPGVTWFYNEITFFKSGEYNVYVYDERDKLLGVGKVRVNVK